MAFKSHELSVLAYANGFTLWHYRTEDSLEDLLSEAGTFECSGYFGSACDRVCRCDRITVNLDGGEQPDIVDLTVTKVRPDATVRVALVRVPPLPVRNDPALASHAEQSAPARGYGE